mgnify:CR=1 FL=1
MKFLICGLGSIGQRHYRNLLSLGHSDIIVFRSGKGSRSFVDKFVSEFNPKIYNNVKTALSQKPDVVFITNPTYQHIPIALLAAKAGCHLFIEKPISHNIKNIKELLSEVNKRKLISYIAYNFRFHPLLIEIKKWLGNQKQFGKPISSHACLGERVTDWHSWEDYRKSYSCQKKMGGGVILTQSHEIDFLAWLLGPIVSVNAIGGNLGGLGINVEDVAKILLKFKSGVVGSVDLDYLKRPPKRNLEIVTTKGRILWDYYDKKLEFIPLDPALKKTVVFESEKFERNNMYLDELKYFLKCIKDKIDSMNSLKDGAEIFRIILGAKKSLKSRGILINFVVD